MDDQHAVQVLQTGQQLPDDEHDVPFRCIRYVFVAGPEESVQLTQDKLVFLLGAVSTLIRPANLFRRIPNHAACPSSDVVELGVAGQPQEMVMASRCCMMWMPLCPIDSQLSRWRQPLGVNEMRVSMSASSEYESECESKSRESGGGG